MEQDRFCTGELRVDDIHDLRGLAAAGQVVPVLIAGADRGVEHAGADRHHKPHGKEGPRVSENAPSQPPADSACRRENAVQGLIGVFLRAAPAEHQRGERREDRDRHQKSDSRSDGRGQAEARDERVRDQCKR